MKAVEGLLDKDTGSRHRLPVDQEDVPYAFNEYDIALEPSRPKETLTMGVHVSYRWR